MSPTLKARLERVRRIRHAVAATAVAIFIAVFATVYIQMASGNDPALGTSVTAAAITQSSTSADDTASTTTSDDSTEETTSSTEDTVTTAQS